MPENNYEAIIRAFMVSDTKRDLVIVTNHAGILILMRCVKLQVLIKTNSIKFVGTVYDKALLTAIRQKAFAYLHGHAVGGRIPVC